MMRIIWTLRLAILLRRYRWSHTWRLAWAWARDDEWSIYRDDGYSPKEALIDQASYCD